MTSTKVETSVSKGTGWWVALNVSGSLDGTDHLKRYGSGFRQAYIFRTSDDCIEKPCEERRKIWGFDVVFMLFCSVKQN